MFEHEIRVSRQMGILLKAVVKDFGDEPFTRPPNGMINPPAYIVSHLIAAADLGLVKLGRAPLCTEDWRKAFGPGSKPDPACQYLPKAELLQMFDRNYDELRTAVSAVTPQLASQPHGIALFSGSLIESTGDLIVLLLTSHLGIHIGQMSAMRRQLGFPPLF
jgi:hypothetical protein